MRKTLISLLALFIFIANPAFSAATINFDSDAARVVISEVELGQKITITQSDLASAIAARTGGEFDGNNELELLFTFDSSSQEKILNFIDGGFELVNRPELRVIKTTDPSAYSTSLEYALVDASRVTTGALTAAGPRTTETNNGETSYMFRIQDLSNSNSRIPIMYLVINSALTYSGSFDIIFNFFSADETIEGTLSEEDSNDNSGEENEDEGETLENLQASLQTSMFDAADTEVEIYRKINYTFNCETDLDGTTLNICDADELELLNTELQESLDLINSSRDALRSAFKTTKEINRDKSAISKIERNSILRKIAGAFRKDKKIEKQLKALDKLVGRRLAKEKTLEASKDFKKASSLIKAIITGLKSAYEKCKAPAAKLIFDAQQAEQDFLDQYPESIDDYELLEEDE
ncbi:MAG: hypothetical protein HRT47_12045 [Candidatus Caenarcaniphilales bacterium]|nr:hypothetical protein [Candidatus Caenarcaniphilales bacterium]